ncbi:cold-shock protein [Spongiactinospora rosea]|uniref:cold-shock protein n=1 Tax=Spongiactinospora rosea TaxID=2248750 RepID=UPI0013143E1C|nr:cold shock domain-containing protein [Spongiactinospora rosea]
MRELPSGRDAWAHFSDIVAVGYRVLEPGDRVEFELIQRRQDGYDFVAVNIRTL